MASSDPAAEQGFERISPSIYGSPRAQATKAMKLERFILGVVAGAATWMLIDLLGAPHIFGIGSDAGLIPFALLAAILSFTRIHALIPSAAFVLLCVVIVIGYTDIGTRSIDRFIRVDPMPASADVVVVLSAGVTADGYLSPEGVDRALKGVMLVQDGVAPALLFTREERTARGVKASGAADQLRLSSLARLDRVFTTRQVKSTHDEALAVRDVARHRGWRKIVLVTSPFHSRRACATFERAGLALSCIPSDSRDVPIRRLVYPRDRRIAFGLSLYETAGTLRYRLAGWM